MTRKNKKKEKESTNPNVSIEEKIEVETKQEELKLLEGEEQKVLDYFSKDDLIEKIEKLENELKLKIENLEKVQNESADWKKKFMRLQAEFENAEKRWNKNRQNLRIKYTASTLKSFLPLYDSFKKALQDDNEKMEALKGFYNQFMNILKSHKAEPIDVKINDLFDYSSHEALSSIERDDLPNSTIIEIIQDGWKINQDIIRYAKVIISRVPKPPEPEPKIDGDQEPKSEEISEEKRVEELKKNSNKKEENQNNSVNNYIS